MITHFWSFEHIFELQLGKQNGSTPAYPFVHAHLVSWPLKTHSEVGGHSKSVQGSSLQSGYFPNPCLQMQSFFLLAGSKIQTPKSPQFLSHAYLH